MAFELRVDSSFTETGECLSSDERGLRSTGYHTYRVVWCDEYLTAENGGKAFSTREAAMAVALAFASKKAGVQLPSEVTEVPLGEATLVSRPRRGNSETIKVRLVGRVGPLCFGVFAKVAGSHVGGFCPTSKDGGSVCYGLSNFYLDSQSQALVQAFEAAARESLPAYTPEV